AQVVLLDLYETRLQEAMEHFSPDEARALPCDVRKPAELEAAFVEACRCFGGVDILVHSAGLAVSKPLEATTIDDWRVLQEVLVQGQFLLARQAADIMRRQGFGGDMIFIASKNGLTAGPNNVAYGTAKAAQLHMTRLLAAELAADGIRVNAVNPDGVVLGSKIWEGAWAEGRARAYGIRVEDLPEFYAQRNLLKQAIRPEDVAEAVFAFLALLPKTTGQMLNVDGGMPAAFVR
ncbi:MAG: SDR family oxidoreductase, partial [Bacteroidetes bacterium]